MPNPLVTPPFLQPGDRVGVVAMASRVAYDALLEGLEVLRNEWHLEVIEGYTLRSAYHQFAANDADRLADFQQMLDDVKVKAIFSARGGYGSSRLLDKLNFRLFKKNPKWIVGFSDITAVHCHLHRLGVESIHGTMPKIFRQEGGQQALESLRQVLFGETVAYEVTPHSLNREGQAQGQIVGGNLCLIAHLLGSRSALDTRKKILFIEDVDEYLYNIDRMMVQLKRAKVLSHLAGLVVGQFSETKDNNTVAFGKDAYQIIAEHVQEYDYPVCFDFPVGHVPDNRAMIVGRQATLQVFPTAVRLAYVPPVFD